MNVQKVPGLTRLVHGDLVRELRRAEQTNPDLIIF